MAVMTYNVVEQQTGDSFTESRVQRGAGRLSTWIVSFLLLPWYLELLVAIIRANYSGAKAAFGTLGTASVYMDIAGGILFPIALIWVITGACRPMPRSRKIYMIMVLAAGFVARIAASSVFSIR